MKIVIVGAGGVGTWLIRLLAQEHHEITVIDTKSQLIESLTDHYEVSGICGSGASYSILKKAGMEAVDAFLAVTSSDEANIRACQIAKELGAGHTVARVSGREYLDDIEYFRQRSGIDYVINPELEVAEEILYLLQLPSAVNLQPFMDGSVLLLELNITEHHPLAGMSLYEMKKNFGVSVLARSACMDELGKKKIVALPIENLTMMREINLVYSRDFDHPELVRDIVRCYNEQSGQNA